MHVPDMADQVPPPAESHVTMLALKIFFIHVHTFHMFIDILVASGHVVTQVAWYPVVCHMNVPDMLLNLAL